MNSLSKKRQIPAAKAVIIGLLLMALFWAVTAVYTLFFSENLYHATSTKIVMGLLTAGNAAGFGICAIGLKRWFKHFFFISIIFLAINIIMTLTDQFGTLDLITGWIDIVILIGLIFWKKVKE